MNIALDIIRLSCQNKAEMTTKPLILNSSYHWLILLTAIMVSLPFWNIHAQQVEFHFQVYRLDVKIADALQERLIAGGDPAVQAIAKMPDFVKQKKASLEAELNLQVRPGKRANGASSNHKLEVNKRYREVDEVWEVVDGLEIEMDTVLDPSGSIVDIILYAKFSDRSRDGVKIRQLTSSFSAQINEPFLVTRWQEDEDILLFVGKATSPSSAVASSKPRHIVYLDVVFYQSAVDAQAQRDPIARTMFPSRSGESAKSEILVPLVFDTGDGAMDSRDLGFKVKADPVIDETGVVELTLVLEHIRRVGGRDRLLNGTHVSNLEIRKAQHILKLQGGKIETSGLEISSLGNPNPKPDAWKITISCHVQEVH